MGTTSLERSSRKDPIQEIKGPVLDAICAHICNDCESSLMQELTPKYALANGLWLGAVPEALKDLSYAEQLLVSRVRRSKCIVRVSSGMHKMKANAIMFENPTPKIYQRLPPPVADLDEVLAFIYTGPCRPTPEDLERTPLLVRRYKVTEALEWLKLNHIDYYDLDISYDNLKEYPDHGPPVMVTYRHATTNKDPEAVSAFDNDLEEGVEEGKCAFVVNGITGEQLDLMNNAALTARAAKHLREDNGGVLAIGHSEKPLSIYDNPTLYPMMFPWLFPYGLGGIGSIGDDMEMSDMMHKRRLLMYHDKRFQKDPHFPLVAFNQEQIKKGTTGGYLLTERRNFDDIADRLMNIDVGVLEDLSKRLSRGDRVKPETPEEKACYQLISDLDHVGGHVQGSITSKKYMRNEIWSLISYVGAPSWFITFAPADVKHPICLYYADTKETFSPEIRGKDECFKLIATNPVAGARFFHLVVQMFIKHVLGVEEDHPGLYGDTSAYYGTVEQQGRLTLHLHLLLWISGSLTPQEIREKIMDADSDFQKKMVEYLEALCVGEFLTGSKSEVVEKVKAAKETPGYKSPVGTMPESPPASCDGTCHECSCEPTRASWWQWFKEIVDDLLLKSNQHNHTVAKDGEGKSHCLNSKGQCKRRFPRDTFEQTMVDPKTGALNLKKGEAYMNTVTPELTYLLRSNSDVTSMLSGTAIKAVVAYVTDYITKQALKTYSVFDVVRSIFDKNSEMIGGDTKRREKVRKIFTQVVNSLTAKMEIGGPMASLYILGNPDHYSSHKFVPFYWRGYVKEVLSDWEDEKSLEKISDLDNVPDKVVINKSRGQFVGLSKVQDYMYRPAPYEDVALYDWIRLYEKKPKRRTVKKQVGDAADDPEFEESDDELNIQSVKLEEPSQVFKAEDEDVPVIKLEGGHPVKAEVPLSEFIEDDIGYLNSDEEDEEEDDELDVMDEVAEHVSKKDCYFLCGHSQSQSHQAHMKKEDPAIVPNFLPNTLPRSDRGDREYYCCTMLTLFKPWRSGKDLKAELQSWDKAFVEHEFSKRQMEIIKYFAVRYECLDARDDYSAKRDKEFEEKIAYQWATSDTLASLDYMHYSEAYSGAECKTDKDDLDLEEDALNVPGKNRRYLRDAMASAERTLKLAGWMDESEDGLPDVGSLKPVKPLVDQPAKSWRAAVLARKQEIMDDRNKHIPSNSKYKSRSFKPNVVEVVDKSYIDKMFKSTTQAEDDLIDRTVEHFHLNAEQERAFRIVANHATVKNPEKLHMYLGGMGGTGKSQVIKAIIYFFGERNENHRFLVVAPTGAAAALLNGSTYHSVLGISDGEFISAKSLAQIKARLDGVDYIFLDEVSMLSCQDMYKISAQGAKARGVHDEAFGGLNFIFAGDFAQLPPARSGPPLYSGSVGTQVDSGVKIRDQEAAIGKALWHQVTTVVILRQNMRQDKQSAEDTALRTALENMRYKSCTPQDVAFLRSRIAGRGPNDPKLAQRRFRNVSIITARNAQKDRINELGCERFAADTNQALTTFYSIDRWKDPEKGENKKRPGRPKKKLIDPVRKTNILPPHVQKILWEQPHSSSNKHIPAKLTLCIGMPVMLRHNDATECCMTKGTEATVVSWQSGRGPEGQLVLDTLFVRLTNPPKTVQIDGLPDNIVPLTRHTTATMCSLPNDDEISLSREQVLVLPNFAMTDYSSQGRTRPDNPVDLNSCRTHQSYYTCLSRSASAAGTIIVQGFDPKIITGGASGYLRQEFRELELLDEITRLKYEGVLPDHILGKARNTVIQQFQKWKGSSYVPSKVHSAICWSKSDPLEVDATVPVSPWQIVKKSNGYDANAANKPKLTGFVAAKGTVPIVEYKIEKHGTVHGTIIKENIPVMLRVSKRKLDEEINTYDEHHPSKKPKAAEEQSVRGSGPLGIVWDGENYSCAYDALFTILLSVWTQNPSRWKARFKDMNRSMNLLASGFHRATEGRCSLEAARNKVRHILNQRSPDMFPYGQRGTNIGDLTHHMFRSDEVIASYHLKCTECGSETIAQRDLQTCVLQCPQHFEGTTAQYLSKVIKDSVPDRCTTCNGKMDKVTRFRQPPAILAFSQNEASLKISKRMKLDDGDSSVVFTLKGVIYFGAFHFTARIVLPNSSVWFHDGMDTASSCQYENKLEKFSDTDLMTCDGKKATLMLYAQV